MEASSLGLILDSSVVIEAERQRLDAARFLKHLVDRVGEHEAALCAISVAELAPRRYNRSAAGVPRIP